MPTLAVVKDYLFQLIGKTYTDDQFTDLCFEFGVELDDITSEKEMYMREQGKTSSDASAADKLSDEVIYKIDTPANRYDLLSAEGMAVALKVFLGTMPLPAYRVLNKSAPLYTMTVEKSVKNVRDYVICAVLRNVHFNERSYNSFIDFQEKLHSGLARRRTLASVGTHDLDVIQNTPSNAATKNKFIYGCRPKHTISFIPLRQTTVMHCEGNGLEEFFKDDRHIGKYVPLISSLPNYPVVLDGSGETVLSLPPIINSAHSAISVRTKNIFIECTAPDHQKASVLVNQMVAAFSQFCEEPFTVEAVEVCYEDTCPDGTTREVTPVLDEKELTVSLEKVNNFIGVEIPSAAVCAEHLKKMMHHIKEVNEKEGTVTVLSPAVRSDVIGVSDIMEDVAIGYGYDNIEYKECTTYGDVTQTALGKVSQLLRQEMAAAGYVELLTFSLCSREEAFDQLGRVDKDTAVHIANPQTIEFQVCRPSLLPGVLKTLAANKSQPLPHRFFECADVVLLDNPVNFPPALETETGVHYDYPGARNQLHIAAIHCVSGNSGFESTLALTQHVLLKLGIPRRDSLSPEQQATTDCYELTAGDDGAFFPSRCVAVQLYRQGTPIHIGGLGVIHPNTLKAYDITFPCSYMELNIQFLCTKLN